MFLSTWGSLYATAVTKGSRLALLQAMGTAAVAEVQAVGPCIPAHAYPPF